MSKVSLAKGTRDFPPEVMIKRNFITETIQSIFEKFGFLPIETPSIENMSVLSGKYGEEGDKLLFKILNSGDFLKGVTPEDIKQGAKGLSPKIAEKGLRYDLTVPFARFVSMNRNELAFPFKRFQIQPVWRADRPQKGRFREFYQCDADVVGSPSLLYEMEIIQMTEEVFEKLGIKNFEIKINHRSILSGIRKDLNLDENQETTFFVLIDKLDKVPFEKLSDSFTDLGINTIDQARLQTIFESKAGIYAKLDLILEQFPATKPGVIEIKEVVDGLAAVDSLSSKLNLDFALARGLSYYTGAIFEVKALDVSIGSVSGGGRYDNLTGNFGYPDVSGVGISYGIDRLYVVMEELGLFDQIDQRTTQFLIVNFEKSHLLPYMKICKMLRKSGLRAEIYPDAVKMKKQFNYANKKGVPFVIILGEDEVAQDTFQVKNMKTGDQQVFKIDMIEEITALVDSESI